MKLYNDFLQCLSAIKHLQGAIGVLTWDQEVMMPVSGVQRRAEQISCLAGIRHEKLQKELLPIVNELREKDLSSLDPKAQRNIGIVSRELDQALKLPSEFVAKLSKTVALAHQSWVESRKKSDFSIFQPLLEQIFELKREEAELHGYAQEPYDALLNQYDYGLNTKILDKVFQELRTDLHPLLMEILKQEEPDDQFLLQKIPQDDQLSFTKTVIQELGYDLEQGRIDSSAHPFTISFSANDVRITTSYNEHNIFDMLYSSIHEAGHAIYEQGLVSADYALPSGEYCSLSIHESQSRIWENNVGRSAAFWNKYHSILAQNYPDKLKGFTAADTFRASNKVKRSLVRIYADELSYHYHILLRYELERGLMNKEFAVRDLPGLWNEKIKRYLDLDVPGDAKGVLQDIHWSQGGIGYFPTYSLGSFYAAQFMNSAKKEIGPLANSFASGDFTAFKNWLNTNIHQEGRLYTSEELCERVTGEPLNLKYFMQYIREKYSKIYQLSKLNQLKKRGS